MRSQPCPGGVGGAYLPETESSIRLCYLWCLVVPLLPHLTNCATVFQSFSNSSIPATTRPLSCSPSLEQRLVECGSAKDRWTTNTTFFAICDGPSLAWRHSHTSKYTRFVIFPSQRFRVCASSCPMRMWQRRLNRMIPRRGCRWAKNSTSATSRQSPPGCRYGRVG